MNIAKSNNVLILFFMVLLVLASGCERGSPSVDIQVKLEVKFNGRAEDLAFDLKCHSQDSVFAATLKSLAENEVSIDYLGDDGETAFVTAIAGVVNEKSAGDNWVYRVNGKLGSVGSGVADLSDGDRITWSFGKYEPEN